MAAMRIPQRGVQPINGLRLRAVRVDRQNERKPDLSCTCTHLAANRRKRPFETAKA